MSNEKVFTDANFEAEVLKSNQPVLVDFWAEWCGPCRQLAPVVEKITNANAGKVTVGKLNVDENQNTPQRYGIQGIPTLILFKNGQEVQRMVGYQSQQAIQKNIDAILSH
jgi:thioredoxin 1